MAARILAVDDEPAILKLIAVSLGRAGYEVETAADGQEALERVAADRPALIVMDVMMPHMDGFETLAKLKEQPDTASIPVVMLTAKRHDADLLHSMEAGAVSYLTKPFNPTELVTVVQRVLGGDVNDTGTTP